MEDGVKLCCETYFRCSICYNDIANRTEIFQLEACHCQFCIECIRQYCNSQINTPLVLIRCPNLACDSLITLNEILPLVTNAQFEIYKKRLFDHEVTNDPRRIFCPQVDCGHVLILSDAQMRHSKQPIMCSSCQTTFCLKCRCPWHPNKNCSDLITSDAMNIESTIKRCPQCHFPLEWAEGCAQMMCINCKHLFCWYCLKSLDSDLFLLHYERGPCRNRLGHSRVSLFLHRLLVVLLCILCIILFIIASPLILLILPCLICYRHKQIKYYFDRFIRQRQSISQTNPTVNIEQQPLTSLFASLNFDTCNNDSPQLNDILSV